MKIYVSYRRSDTLSQANRVAASLDAHFGTGSASMDVDAVTPGKDIRATLETTVEQCDVVLVLIGKEWLGAGDRGEDFLDLRRVLFRSHPWMWTQSPLGKTFVRRWKQPSNSAMLSSSSSEKNGWEPLMTRDIDSSITRVISSARKLRLRSRGSFLLSPCLSAEHRYRSPACYPYL